MKKSVKLLREDQKIYMVNIEHLENQLIKGQIKDKEYHSHMENLKNQFKD